MFRFKRIITYTKTYWILILLTGIGGFLRLYNIKPTISFLGDQGRDALVVRTMITELKPVLIGPTTSVGKIQLGPLYYYFMAPWLLIFNYDPLGPAVGVALLGIITIPVLFFVIKRMFDTSTALIASFLYTFGSVIIANTRTSWNPNPMPLVVILLLWTLYETYVHAKYRHIIWSCLLWGISLQLHYMALILAPFLALIWLLTFTQTRERREVTHNLLLGTGVFLLTLIPLVIFDLRHNYLNLKGLMEFFITREHTAQNFAQPIELALERLNHMFGQLIGLSFSPHLKLWFSRILAVVFAGICWLSRKKKIAHILFLYFLCSWAGLSFYQSSVYDHYLGFTFPLPFIIMAVGLAWVWKSGKTWLRLIVIGILGVYLYINVTHYSFFNPLGWQMDDMRYVSKVIASDAGSKPYNIILVDDTKDYRAMSYRYFLSLLSTPVKDIGEFEIVDTVYLITQYQYPDVKQLETREIEAFLNVQISSYDNERLKDLLKEKIINQWYFEDGPWVYKLTK